VSRRTDLTMPRQRRRVGVHYDPDAFGNFSESIARFLGTARFLVYQSVIIAVWIVWNTLLPSSAQFDPWERGLVLLTLVLSLQASYAAPLILLAQNRQEIRDRGQIEIDRRVAERTQNDTEFLARELASVRLALGDIATSSELDDKIDQLTRVITRLSERIDALEPAPRQAVDVASSSPSSRDDTSA
jgi:uncharacterized membrane protein